MADQTPNPMSVDERLVFLLQSTESLHATVHELSGDSQRHQKMLEEQMKTNQILMGISKTLTNLYEDHERRISGLEKP